MRLIFVGLSLSSSWGNGHATTYRALLRALRQRGHEVLFLERDQPWYAAHRDLSAPGYCTLRFYDRPEDLDRYAGEFARADAVVIGSYVPDGAAVIGRVAPRVRHLLCFYDIDTPVTLQALGQGGAEYLLREQVRLFDLYLSFTGGPTLRQLERRFGARIARPLYCGVDAERYGPVAVPLRWDLGYLGTYSDDRQPALERLLIEPARRNPDLRFVVAGPLYPAGIAWPSNVARIEHVSPEEHPRFYSSLCWTLNLTRAEMRRHGYSPSVRLFEAGACGTPIISDDWPGLRSLFVSGREIMLAETTADVLSALSMPDRRRRAIGAAARARTLEAHSAESRARQLENYLREAMTGAGRDGSEQAAAAEGAEA